MTALTSVDFRNTLAQVHCRLSDGAGSDGAGSVNGRVVRDDHMGGGGQKLCKTVQKHVDDKEEMSVGGSSPCHAAVINTNVLNHL